MSNASRSTRIHQAFRILYPQIVGELFTEIMIGLPSISGNGGPSTFQKFMAIWDTGASHSVITPHIVKALNLIPSGKTEVSGVNSKETRDTFIIDLGLPNKVHVPNWRVTECEINSDRIDALIGMDIIQNGDFSIANGTGATIFSFAFPSFKNPTDLYEKANSINPRVK